MNTLTESAARHALYAEMITYTAWHWHAASLTKAIEHDPEVQCPVSGDKLACLNAGPGFQLHLYSVRDRPMQARLHAIAHAEETAELWIEGEL